MAALGAQRGMTKAERRQQRVEEEWGGSDDEERQLESGSEDGAAGEGGGKAAGFGGHPDSALEAVRLPRARLEMWQVEPFFESMAKGCLVRIGIEHDGSKLYRAALVAGVAQGCEPYSLAGRKCCKKLQLDFGEATLPYPMTVVSNGELSSEFEAVELRAFEQVLEARGRSPFSGARLAEKAAELRRAVAGERKSYSEAEVTRMVNQNSQNKAAGAAPQLTARQKLAQRAGVGSGHVAVARPMQMQYDRFGRAIVQEQQGS
ncbi:hypothetical protein EMIHUDRAFT_451547 [Emiliania huxleyi CCMP1516]|nr:hypothetical protein EMIHUDRAFT_451547 [Emiliania huxleyi CCMP1516]EOD16376.1 hypothetical protein EMIHUDRAFT_451547 [Emiliania huxleyi CCMP1516]|eukprot:XP_005768805.1 hypothetical protein EMIHUDRAFT_451547 [Emiliania huxleyi CCMP1516]